MIRAPSTRYKDRKNFSKVRYTWKMSLVELESLVVVAEEQHLGRAAKRLFVSQPPLTRRIQKLEAELGLRVFERSAKGMHLRPEAAPVIQQARRVLQEVLRLKSLTSQLREKQSLVNDDATLIDQPPKAGPPTHPHPGIDHARCVCPSAPSRPR